MPTFPKNGCLLGVDYGSRRVGLAVCDEDRKVSMPLSVYERRTPTLDADWFRQLAQQHRVVGLVVGLPLHMKSGDEGQLARDARAFGTWLSGALGLPVGYVDERLTTSLAHRLLAEAGVKAKARKGKIDKLAAQILLQTYLETGEAAAGHSSEGR